MSRIELEGRGKDDWTMAIIEKKEKRRGCLFFLTRIVYVLKNLEKSNLIKSRLIGVFRT
jgi:hypothetical protein